MPEGHVIHRTCDALVGLFRGAVVCASSPQGRFTLGASLLNGGVLLGAYAHGKHLFAEFDLGHGSARVLHVHLGLYGAWSFATTGEGILQRQEYRFPVVDTAAPDAGRVRTDPLSWPPTPKGVVRLRLLSKGAVADLNGPSQCEVLTRDEVTERRVRLGPDPLLDDADPAAFIRAVRSSRRASGELLMDQRVISGVGNIYRAELLYRQRLHPAVPGQRVSVVKLRRLWSDAVRLMSDGRHTGVIITADPKDRPAIPVPTTWSNLAEHASDEEADARWYVYRRGGRPCHRCGVAITTTAMAGRQVYWCHRCQRAPRA